MLLHKEYLKFVITLGNCFRILNPIALTIIRFHDPYLQTKLYQLFNIQMKNTLEESTSVLIYYIYIQTLKF